MKNMFMTIKKLSAITLTILFLASCNGSAVRPDWLDRPGIHPKYGGDDYFQAVGSSKEGRRQAEQQAKAEVSAQVQSSLQAVFSQRTEEVTRDKTQTSLSELKSLISSSTDFDRAELIRIDKKTTAFINGVYYAFAHLDKKELKAAVEPEYRQKAIKFQVCAGKAQNAYENGDPEGFTSNYNCAVDAMRKMENSARLIQMADSKTYTPHESNIELFCQLISNKTELKDGLKFYLVFNGPQSNIGKQRIESLMQELFQDVALKTTMCRACPCQGSFDYRFIVFSIERCNSGYLGPVCTLSLSAVVEICEKKQTVFQIDLNSEKFKGVHISDKGLALEELYVDLDTKDIKDRFISGMKSYFPIQNY